MVIELRDLDTLDADAVNQNLTETVARVQEDNPQLDLRRGVLFSILAYYHAVLATQTQANITDYLNARSLLALNEDPALADPLLVDDVLSNYNLVRKPGEKATGSIVIVLKSNVGVVIGLGAIFEGRGKQFVTTQVFTAKPEAALIDSAGDRLMTQTADGNYAFTIDVEAIEEGADYQLKRDTLVTPLTVPSGYVTSYAASDFIDGKAVETNDELLLRQQAGVAAASPSNRITALGMLYDVEAFSRILHLSIVGFGQPEMLRDKHTIFPISYGGKTDWYIRSQEQLYSPKLIKSARLISKNTDNTGVWSISLSRDDAPGFYEIRNIRLPGSVNLAGGFTVTEEARTLDVSGYDFVPDMASVVEGVYSRFQTAVIKFTDTTTNVATLSVGSTQDYELEAATMPLVAELQDHLLDPAVGHFCADHLVKGPVPCFLKLSFAIHKQSSEPDPDLTAIAQALAATVNKIGFIGRLYASQLHDVIHGFLHNATSVGAIDMFGRIRYPNGENHYVRSSEVLKAPEKPGEMVSPRTVGFFLSPEDVSIAVVTAVPSAV